MTDTATLPVSRTYIRRSASTSIEVVDEDQGRLLGRIVPFGETARIRETVNGELIEYDEEFLPNCTQRLRDNLDRFGAHMLRLQLGHDDPGVAGQLGFGLSLSERADGAYGEFQLYHERPDYPHVRQMLRTAWRGLSVSFRDRVPPVVDSTGERTLIGRKSVDIEHIAAVNVPAYASAGVLSIRHGDESAIPDAGTPDRDAITAFLAEERTRTFGKHA